VDVVPHAVAEVPQRPRAVPLREPPALQLDAGVVAPQLPAVRGRDVHSHVLHQISYVDHTGLSSTGCALVVTPGCQIGYMDPTGYVIN
jgi:hypothetical protein